MKGKIVDFIILGAQKCGTKSVGYYLNQHSDISINHALKGSEVHFFDSHWKRGVHWYKKHFTYDTQLVGECSPSYIFKTASHPRMKEVIPGTKFILLLREPGARSYSQWNMDRNRKKHCHDFQHFKNKMSHEYFKRGCYVDQIKHFLKYFPPDQLHICITERLGEETQKEMNKIFEFLNVPKMNVEITPKHKRSYTTSMPSSMRCVLDKFYSPYNERLFEFLGEDIKEWNI